LVLVNGQPKIAEVWKAGVGMVSSNKILTVSYGTFSCTLEGFDDSFDTMKAIAEYFRDLAQDDRYFGAEPPTPDAEMLARIAEREIERRVEARFEKGNLVLRPTDDTEPPHGDVAQEQSSGAALVGTTTGLTATGVAVADTLKDEDGSQEKTSANEDLLIDLSHLATDQPEDDVTLDTSDLDLSDITEESEAQEDTVQAEVETDMIADAPDGDDTDTEDEFNIDELIAAQVNDAPEEDVAEDIVADEVEEVEAELVADLPEHTDTVAEKLQRIRAVVASKSQEEPEYIEDEHAMSGLDDDGNDENDAIDVDTQIAGFDEDDLEDEDNLFADTIAAIVNDEIAEDDAPTMDADDDANVTEDDASDTESELDALRAKIAALEAQAASAAAKPSMPVENFDAIEEADISEVVDAAQDDAAPGENETPLPVLELTEKDVIEDAPKPIVARVSKAKRADVEAALAAGAIEEYDDEDGLAETVSDADAHPVPGSDDSSLTSEQEAELARELADLQAEIEEDDDWNFDVSEEQAKSKKSPEDVLYDQADDEEEAEANIRKAVKMSSPGRAMLTDKAIAEDDASVDRLIGQTETEMHEPEGNRRRSAIAHLRAAVAATKADRLLGLGKKKVDEEEPYREDLADAVRPRRPKVTQSTSERPAPVRSAPLKLVAEQRVDKDDADFETTPVRPRRVMRADPIETIDETASSDTGFAEFAESQGANTLQELLEAAAAYMSFVEGRDQFSRPQLMTKLHQAEGEASSREERLRSFGKLLREGKIQKKGGGRFAASDNIGFKPSARAAG
jgi:hypothetical protein